MPRRISKSGLAAKAREWPRPWRMLLGAVTLTAALVLAAGALAYLSSQGEGVAEASVTKLAPPTNLKAVASTGGTVALTWEGSKTPAGGSPTYFVTRNGDEAGGTCPGEEEPTSVTSCTDGSLAPGNYEYIVSSVYNSWTRESAPVTVEVTVGPIAKFAIKSNTSSPATGEGVKLTITAQDSSGGTVSTYTGSHSFKFSGASESPSGAAPTVANSSGTATVFGSATTLSFSAGVATATSTKNGLLRIYKAGEASITATEGSLTTPTPLVLNVLPVASKYTMSAASTTPSAGAADNLTITAFDAWGNTATTYAGTKNVVFSGASESATGVKPTVTSSTGTAVAFGTATPINFTAGVATTSGSNNGAMTLYKSGSASIKATEGSITNATAVAVTVAPLAATSLTMAPSSTTPVVAASDNLVITAKDTYGNVATSYAGSKSFTFSGAEASPSGMAANVTNASGTATNFGTATALTFTNGVNSIASGKNGVAKFFKAGATANVSATDGTFTTPSVAITPTPAATSKFVLAAATTTPAAGAEDGLTITAQDAYGNTATAYTGAKSLTFSGASESATGVKPTVSNSSGTDVAFGTATAINFSAGVATTSGEANGGMTIYKSGSASIKATEGSITNTAVTVTVSPLAATGLTLSGTTPIAAGASDNLTITAKDTYGNIATSYAGSKSLTFSGAEASPSGTAPTVSNASGTATNFGTATALTFTSGVSSVSGSNNGVMKLNKAGTSNVVATDGTFTTPAVAFTVTPGTASRVAFTSTTASAGTIASPCLFTCTVTSLGNSGTVKSNLAITDSLGNVVSNIGASKTATITVSGSPVGTISGSPLSFPETGSAISTTQFTFTAPSSSGSWTNTITAASSGYASATATVSK